MALSRTQEATLKEVFHLFAADADGSVSAGDLCEIFDKLRRPLSDDELPQLLGLVSKTESDSLTYADFRQLIVWLLVADERPATTADAAPATSRQPAKVVDDGAKADAQLAEALEDLGYVGVARERLSELRQSDDPAAADEWFAAREDELKDVCSLELGFRHFRVIWQPEAWWSDFQLFLNNHHALLATLPGVGHASHPRAARHVAATHLLCSALAAWSLAIAIELALRSAAFSNSAYASSVVIAAVIVAISSMATDGLVLAFTPEPRFPRLRNPRTGRVELRRGRCVRGSCRDALAVTIALAVALLLASVGLLADALPDTSDDSDGKSTAAVLGTAAACAALLLVVSWLAAVPVLLVVFAYLRHAQHDAFARCELTGTGAYPFPGHPRVDGSHGVKQLPPHWLQKLERALCCCCCCCYLCCEDDERSAEPNERTRLVDEAAAAPPPAEDRSPRKGRTLRQALDDPWVSAAKLTLKPPPVSQEPRPEIVVEPTTPPTLPSHCEEEDEDTSDDEARDTPPALTSRKAEEIRTPWDVEHAVAAALLVATVVLLLVSQLLIPVYVVKTGTTTEGDDKYYGEHGREPETLFDLVVRCLAGDAWLPALILLLCSFIGPYIKVVPGVGSFGSVRSVIGTVTSSGPQTQPRGALS